MNLPIRSRCAHCFKNEADPHTGFCSEYCEEEYQGKFCEECGVFPAAHGGFCSDVCQLAYEAAAESERFDDDD